MSATGQNLETEYLECPSCYGTWVLSAAEKDFFISRDLQFPKRCHSCRAKRRELRKQIEGQRSC